MEVRGKAPWVSPRFETKATESWFASRSRAYRRDESPDRPRPMTAAVAGRLVRVLASAARRLGIPGEKAAVTLARRFGFAGFVARHSLTAGDAVEHRGEVLLQSLYERMLVQAASELSSSLAARDIPHFFLKGVALAGWLYEPGDRTFVDVDLCVAPEARGEALDTLRVLGYREYEPAHQSGPAELRPGVTLVSGAARSALETVVVDVRWGIEPVDRLLPRADTPVPDAIWHRVARTGSLPAPAPEHHAALVLHHLVHHDLLHVRGLVDFALLWQRLSGDAGKEFEETAGRLGVLRAGRVLSAVLVQDLALERRPGIGPPPRDLRGRQLARLLKLERWLTWAGATSVHEHVAITPRRVARRVLLLDRLTSARRLVADAVWPPREFLRWRWPDARSLNVARGMHLLSVARKLGRP